MNDRAVTALAGGGFRPLARSRAARAAWSYPGKQGGTAEQSFVPEWTKDFLLLRRRATERIIHSKVGETRRTTTWSNCMAHTMPVHTHQRSNRSGRHAGKQMACIIPILIPVNPNITALTMLPYPSGDLHIGHWYAMTPIRCSRPVYAHEGLQCALPHGLRCLWTAGRKCRHPPAHPPQRWTYANIDRMRTQLKSMGAMFDWRREAGSCDPEYYRWTQWFFLKLYEARPGLP